MRERQKLEVTFDFNEACDFIRAVYSGHKLEAKKNVEGYFDLILDTANLTTLVSIEHAIKAPHVNTSDFMMGLKTGLALAVAVSRPTEDASIRDFLQHFKKSGQNVTDIAEAFRKRGQS